jgi:hypothetical protein
MVTGKKYNNQEILRKMKVGEYIRWRPVVQTEYSSDCEKYGFKSFVGVGEEWQYGLILNILESPKKKDDPEAVQGLHLQLLKDGQTDWIFNFDYFEEIEIIGKLDQD